MIMLADWHPDIVEFIISKMQNPRILRYLIENTTDESIIRLAKEKLKFKPLSAQEEAMYQGIVNFKNMQGLGGFSDAIIREAEAKLRDGGTYTVHNPDFLTGANISVTLTNEFMHAVENDLDFELRFPDVANYSPEEMAIYNNEWHKVSYKTTIHYPSGNRFTNISTNVCTAKADKHCCRCMCTKSRLS